LCSYASPTRARRGIYEFTPEDQFDIKGSYAKHTRKGGLGVPLVAARIYYGATAVIRFVGRRLVVSFEDWLVSVLVVGRALQSRRYPLSNSLHSSFSN
jgi:hypothetical protein